MKPQLEKQLKEYFRKSKRLEKQGGPEQNLDLFEDILVLEQQLLSYFGLPHADKYRKVLWQLNEPSRYQPQVGQQVIEALQDMAEAHLLAPVHTALQVLQQAQQEQLDPFDVLPELGFPSHVYTLYLYEQLLLPGKATPAAILKELERVKAPQLLDELGRLTLKSAPRRTKTYRQLKDKLPFLEGFIDHELAEQAEEEENNREQALLAATPPTPVLLAPPLQVARIICIERTNISMVVQVQKPAGPETLTLGLQLEEFERLLSDYKPLGHQILAYTRQVSEANPYEELTYEVDLEEQFGKQLTIDKHALEVIFPQIRDASGRLEENTLGFALLHQMLAVKKIKTNRQGKTAALQHVTDELRQLQAAYSTYREKLAALAPAAHLTKAEQELVARHHAGLQDERLFTLAHMLYELYDSYYINLQRKGKK